jgi:hypothetical protein
MESMLNIVHGNDPKPPAFHTATARALPWAPAMGAWIIGKSVLRSSRKDFTTSVFYDHDKDARSKRYVRASILQRSAPNKGIKTLSKKSGDPKANPPNERIQEVIHEKAEIVSYDSLSPDLFKKEATHLRRCIPLGFFHRIEHFGSTAVPAARFSRAL